MKLLLMLLLIGLVGILFSSCSTKIYLVRHAEKQNGSDTSTLTMAGQLRAFALRDKLLSRHIDSIFTSKYLRTQLTAEPLAKALNENLIIYNLDSTKSLASHLKNLKRKNVLVVGHTSNIPKLVNIITGAIVQIPESDFDNLFVIEIKRFLKSKIILTRETYSTASL